MKTSSLVFFILFSSLLLRAQDLHIHYDVQSQAWRYVSGGQQLDRPVVHPDGNVYLHINNYNNYRFEVEVEKKVQDRVAASGLSGIKGLLPSGGGQSPLGLLSGAGLQDILGVAGSSLDAVEELGLNDIRGALAESKSSEQIKLISQELTDLLDEMEGTETAIKKANNQIKSELERRRYTAIARRELDRLKQNPRLSPQKIKAFSEAYILKALGTEDLDELELDFLDQPNEQRRKLQADLETLQQRRLDYRDQYIQLGGLDRQLGDLQVDDPMVRTLRSTVTEVYQQAEKLAEKVEANQQKIDQVLQQPDNAFLNDLIQLRYELAELQDNTFSYTYHTEADSEDFTLHPRLVPRDSSGGRQNDQAISIPPLKVRVKGGLRINSNVGISAGQFFRPPQEYTLRQGAIVGDNKDSFIPTVSTMISFYPKSLRQVTLGGSLGIGLPLTGNNPGQSITLMLGPSLVIGNRDAVIISAGIMGGQVERLAGGFKVGDTFDAADGVLPTRNVYELGYFFGLSSRVFGRD